MGEGCIGIEAFVLKFVYCVYSVWEELILDAFEIVSGYDCLKFDAELVCELAPFGEELKAHIGNLAVFKLAIDYKIIFVCHFFQMLSLKVLSADGMVGDKIDYQSLEFLVVVLYSACFLCCEDNVFDRFHFCRRSSQTALFEIRVHACGIPFAD